MRAALIILATAPYAAAGIIDATKDSQGACYDDQVHEVTCFVDNATCTSLNGYWTAPGYVDIGHSRASGCCWCNSNCDHTQETGTECDYYDTSAGSCYEHGVGVTCDVKQSTCEAAGNTYYAPGFVGSSGCCHCDESCDHTKETAANCKASYNDQSQSDGSCYDGTSHQVTCDVGHAACDALGHAWYAPGHISTRSGCCHCSDSCNHALETGTDCSAGYYDVTPSPTRGPTTKTIADAAAATTVGVLAAAATAAAALL